MALIEQKNKFGNHATHKKQLFSENDFFKWTSNNFYRTSYCDMKSKVIFRHRSHNFYIRALLIEKIIKSLSIKATCQVSNMVTVLEKHIQSKPENF